MKADTAKQWRIFLQAIHLKFIVLMCFQKISKEKIITNERFRVFTSFSSVLQPIVLFQTNNLSFCLLIVLSQSQNYNVQVFFQQIIVCTPSFCWVDLNLLPNFQKKGGDQQDLSFQRGVAGKEGGNFFQGVCNFYIKNKLKSEIFNNKKKFVNKNILLCHK